MNKNTLFALLAIAPLATIAQENQVSLSQPDLAPIFISEESSVEIQKVEEEPASLDLVIEESTGGDEALVEEQSEIEDPVTVVELDEDLLSYLSPEERELYRLEQLESHRIPFYKVKLDDAVTILADLAEMNYTAPTDRVFNQTITYRGEGNPYEVLQLFAEQYGFLMEFRNGGWVFYTPNTHELILREYELRYNTLEKYDIQANDLNATLSSEGSAGGGGSVEMQSIEVLTDTLVKEVQRILKLPVDGLTAQHEIAGTTKEFKKMNRPSFKSYLDKRHAEQTKTEDEDTENYVYYFRPNNKLIVNATRQQHERVEHLLTMIDQPVRLVQIEVVIVETSHNPITENGINWSGTTGGNMVLSGLQGLPFQGSFREQLENSATLTISDMKVLWNFIETDSDAKVVQSPTGITINKEEIQLSTVVQTPIVTSSGIASADSISTDTFEVQYIDIGTTLVAVPQILEGEDYGDYDDVVNLNFTLSVSTQSGTTIIDENEYPQLTTRQYVNRVIVPDGYTLAIGGLQISEDIDTETGVPLLRDIPFVGRAFETKRKERLNRNLIAFITPRVIDTKSSNSRQINEALEDTTPTLRESLAN